MKSKIGFSVILICFSLLLYSYRSSTTIKSEWPHKIYQLKDSSNYKELTLLGKILFYDPVLSLDSSTSCSSCHSPFNAFAHTDHALSHGIDNKIGFRNAPALFNLAYQPYFMWDGAINHLEMQSLAPMTNPDEMHENMAHVVQKLRRQIFYQTLFKNAFNDTSITGAKTLKALAAFMASIESNSAKYDLVMEGNLEFTEQEKNG